MVGLTLGLLRSLYIKEREQSSRNKGKEMEVMVTIKKTTRREIQLTNRMM